MLKFLPLLCLIAACCAVRAQGDAPVPDYSHTLHPSQRLIVIPLTFPTHAGDGREVAVFADATKGIAVESMKIDGVERIQEARAITIDFDDTPETLRVTSKSHTYVTNVEEGLHYSHPDGGEFLRVKFPPQWTVVDIRYRVRFPGAAPSRPLLLRLERRREYDPEK